MIKVEEETPFKDLTDYVNDTAKRAAGFLVIAFFDDEAPELAQDFAEGSAVEIDNIIATLEKYKAMYVAQEIAESESSQKISKPRGPRS
jgi:hypothetical protein